MGLFQHFLRLWVVALAVSCAFITEEDRLARWDPDSDGIEGDLDCAPNDPELAALGTYYLDRDGDGFGDSLSELEACAPPAGHVLRSGDCDDQQPKIYPGALEACDGVDNNCDGVTDEGNASLTFYLDEDGDGYGGESTVTACQAPPGYSSRSGDCDDSDRSTSPETLEICNGRDDDCDGDVDDEDSNVERFGSLFYPDNDGDGYGPEELGVESCAAPEPGWVDRSGDCADNDPLRSPGELERCNSVDDDCDEEVDEEAVDTYLYFADLDLDGYGDVNAPILSCLILIDGVVNASDCDDADEFIHPEADEVCDDLVDNDCDGLLDDDDSGGCTPPDTGVL